MLERCVQRLVAAVLCCLCPKSPPSIPPFVVGRTRHGLTSLHIRISFKVCSTLIIHPKSPHANSMDSVKGCWQ